MSEHIVVERQGAAQIIRMNRPDKKNALTRAMYAAMAAALTEAENDPDIRVSVLLGVPGAFCAGNDIADFMVIATGGEGGTEVFDFMLALATANKPVVSGVDGVAVGIGTTIQFHCDLTFATPQAVFRTPFTDLGIVPELGSTLLGPALMGHQTAFAMLALGEPFPAERALEAGLIYKIVPEDALEAEVLAAAARIAEKPPTALSTARALMVGDRTALVERIKEEGAHFSAMLKSEEARNAFVAFMSRKK
ncbi:MAG: crotonase/enoyl-CoA hydratase family protein [Rhizobiaceae bacterium]|nr:crotonase/enoyl-CoA hydratase family protein [Rhizobiaceae bacterium]